MRRLLGSLRLLNLTGTGGVGKTRLALASVPAADFADRMWLIDLAPVQDPSLTGNAVASALGVPDLGTKPIVDQLTAFLAHRTT